MNTAVLFSGGKDSCLALNYALEFSEVKCLIIIISENIESYMFHTPNIKWIEKQATAIGIPIILQRTKGLKEAELKDLEKAIKKAKSEYNIEGVVTGAIESVYQASRVQKITNKLALECFNPLWHKNQIELLTELLDKKFDVIISGVAADGFNKNWLGRKIDNKMILELVELNKKYGINPAFEGGEAETIVLYAPFFKNTLVVKKAEKIMNTKNSGIYDIKELDIM